MKGSDTTHLFLVYFPFYRKKGPYMITMFCVHVRVSICIVFQPLTWVTNFHEIRREYYITEAIPISSLQIVHNW
jgi:hypothetical protein